MAQHRELRVPFRLPVSVDRRVAALSADISNKGFSLEVARDNFRSGQDVGGYVLHGDRELSFKGRVVWVEFANPMAMPFGRIGVEFTHVSPGLRALLSIEQRRRR